MKFTNFLTIAALAFCIPAVAFAVPETAGGHIEKKQTAGTSVRKKSAGTVKKAKAAGTFAFSDGKFMLNGKPFQVRGGEIHPQRIPREYWRHRIRMCKAMGLNTIAFYVMWNDFEQPDGSFDFKTGNRDIAAFLQLCADEDMWVFFRPGPFVCGEWDFGGLPVYLLKDKDAKIRTLADKNFMKAQERYLREIAKIAKPFLIKNGGPILLTQIENEYGSWPRIDAGYLRWLKDFWIKQGFGPFYMSDGATDHHLGRLIYPDKDIAVGLDPGTNDGHFNTARKNNPGVPVFSSETYPGWLRHWGEGNWNPTNLSNTIKWFMQNGHSFSLFMAHGGTNFGFYAGANDGGAGGYQADLTSYDYGSPINEQGNPTAEYHQYRKIISDALAGKEKIPDIPKPIPAIEIKDFKPKFFANLRDNTQKLKKPVYDEPPYFEAFDQNQGTAFYRTAIPAGPAGTLNYDRISDWAQIFVDGKLVATVDRRLKKAPVSIPARDKNTTLEIFVEGMGHINFGGNMENDRKGILGNVRLDGKILKKWTVVPKTLSEQSIAQAVPSREQTKGVPGGHFRGTFNVGKRGDTFFDMSKWGKGVLYVNGKNLGRYWSIGPQLRLYCPATFLVSGKNTVDVIDFEVSEARPIRGCKERNYDMDGIKTKNLNNQW